MHKQSGFENEGLTLTTKGIIKQLLYNTLEERLDTWEQQDILGFLVFPGLDGLDKYLRDVLQFVGNLVNLLGLDPAHITYDQSFYRSPSLADIEHEGRRCCFLG